MQVVAFHAIPNELVLHVRGTLIEMFRNLLRAKNVMHKTDIN